MKRLTLDFETYYCKKSMYTLDQMTTIEYVHDPRFKILGVGVQLDDEAPRWINDIDEFREFLKDVGQEVILLCHNTHFDGYILHVHFGWHPAVYADTAAMSRGMFPGQRASLEKLAERLWPNDRTMRKGKELVKFDGVRDLTPEQDRVMAGYCLQDIRLTDAAFRAMEPFYPDRELALIDLTARMYCNPILELDVELVALTRDEAEAERERLIAASGLDPKVLGSNDQFAEWIAAQGMEVPKKISKTTGYETEAFAKDDLEFQQLIADYPEYSHVWDARIAVKSNGEITRANRFLDVAAVTGGKLPVPLTYYSAHTGRYGGSDKLNLQNLGRTSRLRRAIRAPKGMLTYVADSSNIEARMNAWFNGQDDLLELFRAGADIYSLFASEEIYHRLITKKDNPTERFVGKVAVLGLGYRMGADRFRRTLASGSMGAKVVIELGEADRIVQAYRNRYDKISRGWRVADGVILKMLNPEIVEPWGPLTIRHNMLVLPNGMALQYPGLRGQEDPTTGRLQFEYWNGKFWANLHGGILIENIIQALSRIVLFEQMLDIDAYAKPFGGRAVLNVHDEIVTVAPDFGAYTTGEVDEYGNPIWADTSEADEFFAGIETIMRTPPAWCTNLPLDCEGGYDYMYSK